MRRCARLLPVLAAVGAATVACGVTDNDLTLRVTGTEGLQIAGQCVLTTARDQTPIPIDERIPFELELVGSRLSCFIQKVTVPGSVRARIRINGQSIAFASTREPFGAVTVATP